MYTHAPVDSSKTSIRLLRILSTKVGEPIQCSIIHSFIEDSQGKYSALSYTWGPATPIDKQNTIFIDGRPFPVRDNLYHFLDEWHLRDCDRLWWIDAICIDQTNIDERNHQVSQMCEIYTAAKDVCIWLGAADPGLYMQLEETMRKGRWDDSSLPRATASTYMVFNALKVLHKNQYWSRLWVIQEVLVARKVFVRFGKGEFDWEPFQSVMGDWPVPFFNLRLAKRGFAESGRQGPRSRQSWTLVRLLERFVQHDCEDPHDRIYSLLGLASDWEPGNKDLVVDYGLPLETLLSRVSAFCGKYESTLTVFHLRKLWGLGAGINPVKDLQKIDLK